jgi:endo-1,4-beta-xylanase
VSDPLAHRRGVVELVVEDVDGNPLAHRDVVVEQVRHDFGFGNIGFDLLDHANGAPPAGEFDESALADDWLELFNTATLPFYWGRFEPERGHPDTARLHAAARWFRDRGVAVKGHPLVWHTVTAPWMAPLDVAEIERLTRQRVRREVADFAGLIGQWDATNEVVIMPDFTNEPDGVPNPITRLAIELGREGIIRLAFEEARATDPTATLVLNDFDLSPSYERLIETVLAAGIRIDAIGLQTHMHQGYWGEEAMLATVDRFARFGLPLQLTETTLLSGDLMPPEIVDLNDFQPAEWPSTPAGEERQAEELGRHYRSLVEHPSVMTITYWGITDRGAWLGAPSGLLRADGSRKPGYDALHALIKGEWWLPPTTMRTDAAGRVRVEGFHGDYRVGAAAASGAGAGSASDTASDTAAAFRIEEGGGAVLSRTTRLVARSMRGTESSGARLIRMTRRDASSAISFSG